jgi:hypothetical protein
MISVEYAGLLPVVAVNAFQAWVDVNVEVARGYSSRTALKLMGREYALWPYREIWFHWFA